MADLNNSKRFDAPWWRRHLIALIIAAVALIAILAWWHYRSSGDTTAAGGDGTAKGQAKAGKGGTPGKFGGGDPSRAQPVSAVAAKSGDLNVVQTGLGTVTALRTATVKTRADGLLQNVLFKEGETSRKALCLPRSIQRRTRSHSTRRRGKSPAMPLRFPTPSSTLIATRNCSRRIPSRRNRWTSRWPW